MPIYTYTTLDDPLATRVGTIAQGINATGQIVGYYTASVNFHGFLLSGRTYTTLDDPSATAGTLALGINDTGQILGYYTNTSSAHGFLYSGGFYPTLDDPLATTETLAWGINDARPSHWRVLRCRQHPRLSCNPRTECAAARRHHRRHDLAGISRGEPI